MHSHGWFCARDSNLVDLITVLYMCMFTYDLSWSLGGIGSYNSDAGVVYCANGHAHSILDYRLYCTEHVAEETVAG
jgi:hypothetical protein